MRISSRAFTRSILAVGAAALTVPALAAGANATTDTPRVRVQSAPAWTAAAPRLGSLAGATTVQASAILPLRDQAAAEALATAVATPGSPTYHHYLTADQWRTRYAPTAATVDAVKRVLRSNGLTVTSVPTNNRSVTFTGSAAQVAKLIGTPLGRFVKDGVVRTAPAGPVTVPSALGRLVVGFSGLDSSAMSAPRHTTGAGSAETTTTRSTPRQAAAGVRVLSPSAVLPPPELVFRNAPPVSAYYGQKAASSLPQILAHPLTYAVRGYTPGQIRSAYGLDETLAAGYDGRGATVAVVDAFASKYILSDAQTYARRNDPRHPLRAYQFSQSLPASYRYIDECGAAGWYGEETLDVEAVHATAPAANILYVGASSCTDTDLSAAVNSIVDNSLADVITNSYGETDAAQDPASRAEDHQTNLQAAAQGISILFSSGDSGDEIAQTKIRQTDSPASDPFATAVGGTALAVGASGRYLFEQGWGTGRSLLTKGAWAPNPPTYQYGGGGGTSRVWPQPSYQKGVVPASIANYFSTTKPGRAVPDVSMVADPNTGFLVGQSQTMPDGSIGHDEYRIGGTSLSSPLFAGVVAVANQVFGSPLGFVNPLLYSQGIRTGLIGDVDHGRAVTDGVVRVDYVNGYNAAKGTVTTLRTLNQTGSIYTRKGYDDVTGVGSPNAAALLQYLPRSQRVHLTR